jgi:hypothetical protein
VKPAASSTQPSCSTPIEWTFTFQLPACQAMSESWTICTIRPLRETM